jgi:hypothetical protein
MEQPAAQHQPTAKSEIRNPKSEIRNPKSPSYTPRQRMLAAYQGERPDRVPVAPEFWYYLPARLLGLDMIEFQRVPHWQALQETFRHYDCEGWGIVSPGGGGAEADWHTETVPLNDRQYEQLIRVRTPRGELTARQRLDKDEPSWAVERFIKDFARDWAIYEPLALTDPAGLDWRPVEDALRAVDEDYLLEVYVGVPFTDFIGSVREGGFEQMVFDLHEHKDFLRGLRERYVARLTQVIRDTFARTSAAAVFIGCGWACGSLLGPRLWRVWDRPVLAAAADAAHEAGGLIHVHYHGRCRETLDDFADLGLDCVCPFERPPGGDVTDLREVRRRLRGRVTMNGNVHTVETLIRGTPSDVVREVLEILEAWEGQPRLIVGTGDQVGRETPDENLHAMIETVKRYGIFQTKT